MIFSNTRLDHNSSVKIKIGKTEIIRSLGVRDKSIAIRMAREFKICLDHLIDCLLIQEDYQIKPMAYIEDNFRRIRDNYVNGNGAPIPLSIITTVNMKKNDSIIQCNVDNKIEHVVSLDENLTNSQPTTDIEPLFERFKTEKVRLKRWSVKTQNEKNGHFSLLLSILKYIKDTDTIYIEQIQKNDIRQLKEILLLLPKNYNKKFPNLSLNEVIKLCVIVENNEIDALSNTDIKKLNEKISISTICDKYSSTMKGFWQWLNDQSYIESNVFSILKFDAKKTCNSWETLTKVDLENLFNDNIFKKRTIDIVINIGFHY
ncbi:MAG: hypothetical protein Q7U88_12745 [Desulfocapsaceae bacterium]|nr:hypothetical protein [Desulfocapsaceae bacterium]